MDLFIANRIKEDKCSDRTGKVFRDRECGHSRGRSWCRELNVAPIKVKNSVPGNQAWVCFPLNLLWIQYKFGFQGWHYSVALFEPFGPPGLADSRKTQMFVQCLVCDCWNYCTIYVFYSDRFSLLSAAFRSELKWLPNWFALLGSDEIWE